MSVFCAGTVVSCFRSWLWAWGAGTETELAARGHGGMECWVTHSSRLSLWKCVGPGCMALETLKKHAQERGRVNLSLGVNLSIFLI